MKDVVRGVKGKPRPQILILLTYASGVYNWNKCTVYIWRNTNRHFSTFAENLTVRSIVIVVNNHHSPRCPDRCPVTYLLNLNSCHI